MRSLLVACIVVLGAWAAMAHQAHKDEAPKKKTDKDLVQETVLLNAKAYEEKNLKKLDGIWSNRDNVVLFEGGFKYVGWINYRENRLKPGLKAFSNVSYRYYDISIHLAGQTAWTTLNYSFHGKMGERDIRVDGVSTIVLEKQNDKWLIVHSHVSSQERKE